MASRTLFRSASRMLSRRPLDGGHRTMRERSVQRLSYSQNNKPASSDKPAPGPNQQQLPHVSEEAATMSKITGEKGPELEKGTPVQEILKRDPAAKDKAPEVLKPKVGSTSPNGTRSFSTSARRSQQTEIIPVAGQSIDGEGHKFGLPDLPLPERSHLKHREDPVVHQVTQIMIKDGKKGIAQRNMARILNYLRTMRPPVASPTRPLMPNAPPASHLPLNPVLYMTLAIDSVAPLLKIKSYRGMAGGGAALQIPIPLAVRSRRRMAMNWILDAADKKRFRGSGKGGFAQRVAEEFAAIVEGKSSVWEKRAAVHKLGVSARSNLTKLSIRGRR